MPCVCDTFKAEIRSYPLTKRRALLPYGDNNAAPPIELPDTKLFQTERGSLARNYFENKLELLNQEYQKLVELSKLNEALYNAEYNFVPRVGQNYHLYRTSNGKTILSLIEPERWTDQECLGSYVYTADSVWKPLEKSE
jgi:hypothetical protein